MVNGVKLMLSLTINECVEDADGLTGIWLSGLVLGQNTMNGGTNSDVTPEAIQAYLDSRVSLAPRRRSRRR